MRARASTSGTRSLAVVQSVLEDNQEDLEKLIEQNKEEFSRIRQMIVAERRTNTKLQDENEELEKLISLHVKHRISIEEIISKRKNLIPAPQSSKAQNLSAPSKKAYENMFDLLQLEPHYLAKLTPLVSKDSATFAELVASTLFGDRFEGRIERLILILFDLILRQEFTDCDDMGSFMRGNTTSTKLLSAYCFSAGMDSLKTILHDPLTALVKEGRLNFDLAPKHVFEELKKKNPDMASVSEEAMATHPAVAAVLLERQMSLQQFSSDLIDRIHLKIDSIPYGIRYISKHLRDLAYARWPQLTPKEVNPIIGSQFFLRFLTPAIVTPYARGVIDINMGTNTQLTALGRVIQALSNGVPFGEGPMAPLNPFLVSKTAKMSELFEDLCEVEDLDDHMRMELLYSLTKRGDQTITVSLNDIYFTHDLVHNFRHQIAPHRQDPLRQLIERLGPAPSRVEREENFPVVLTLGKSKHESSYTLAVRNEDDDPAYRQLRQRFATLLRIARPMPSNVADCQGFLPALELLKAHMLQQGNQEAADLISQVVVDTGLLMNAKPGPSFVGPEHVLRAVVQDLMRHADIQRKINKALNSAESWLARIREEHVRLKDLNNTLNKYLANVGESQQPPQPASLKFKHEKLEKMKVIVQSELPLDVRRDFTITISTTDYSTFEIEGVFKKLNRLSAQVTLEDVLTKIENREHDLQVQDLVIDLRAFMELINTNFIAKRY